MNSALFLGHFAAFRPDNQTLWERPSDTWSSGLPRLAVGTEALRGVGSLGLTALTLPMPGMTLAFRVEARPCALYQGTTLVGP
jgi:hypothetical protein